MIGWYFTIPTYIHMDVAREIFTDYGWKEFIDYNVIPRHNCYHPRPYHVLFANKEIGTAAETIYHMLKAETIKNNYVDRIKETK